MTPLSKENIERCALAGHAILTLQNGENKHYTYKITVADDTNNLYFVRLLTSFDNSADSSYVYIGCYFVDSNYFVPAKPYKSSPEFSWPKPIRLAKYFFNNLHNMSTTESKLKVYHEGKCCKCGRRLTTPESIERGLGPECYKDTER